MYQVELIGAMIATFFSFSFLFLFWGTYCLEMVGVR